MDRLDTTEFSQLPCPINPSQTQPGSIVPGLEFSLCLTQLTSRDMLPVYFIFSRRGCDKAVADLGSVSLVNEAEAEQLRWQIDNFLGEIQKQAALDKFRLSTVVLPITQGCAGRDWWKNYSAGAD